MGNNTTFRADFADRLKRAKQNAKMTNETISKKLKSEYGIEKEIGTINGHMNANAIPDLPTFRAYCEMFNVSSDYLLFGTGEMDIDRPKEESIHQKLDNYDLRTCLYGLFHFMLNSGVSIEKLPEGFFVDWDKYEERRWKVRVGDIWSNDLNCEVQPEKICLTINRAQSSKKSFEIWSNLMKQFKSLVDLQGFSNSQKFEMAKTVIETEIKQKQLYDGRFTGCFLPIIPDIPEGEDDILPF